MRDQDLGQNANSLRNHSLELKDEVEKLSEELNNGTYTYSHTRILTQTHTGGGNSMFFFCLSDLKPRLDDAQQRLEDAKTKQLAVMEELEKVQSSLNSTTSNLPHTQTHGNTHTHTNAHTDTPSQW